MRNVRKTIEETKIEDNYSFCIGELKQIKDMSEDLFDAICYAFKFGYAMGIRAEKKKNSLRNKVKK